MFNEKPPHISIKESLRYCVLGGMCVYFVAALPRILFYLFPPAQSKGIDIQHYEMPPPDKIPFLISFGLFALLGIYLFKKLNFKNRLAHFSLLGLFLSIGSGVLTSILENFYYLFWIRNSSEREPFLEGFQENWLHFILYEFRLISWAILFLIILVPFTGIFLAPKILYKTISNRNALK